MEWRKPLYGATVTGYIVHYSDGITERSVRLSATVVCVNVSPGRTYQFFVEATCIQLSGVSYSADIFISAAEPDNTANTVTDKIIIIITISAITMVCVVTGTIAAKNGKVLAMIILPSRQRQGGALNQTQHVQIKR